MEYGSLNYRITIKFIKMRYNLAKLSEENDKVAVFRQRVSVYIE